jgi:hypothetical protein
MKNLFNTFTNLLLATALIFSLGSCKKEEIEPDNFNNPADVVANDDVANVTFNTATDINVLSNDNGIDISVSSIVNDPSNGIATINGNSITYTPDVDYSGQDSFTYQISDLTGNIDVAVVTVNVLPNGVVIDTNTVDSNNLPTVQGTISLVENTQWITANSFITDPDGDNITLISMTGASYGEVIVSSNSVRYEPTSSVWWGDDVVTATFTDGNDTVSATITIEYGYEAQRETYELLTEFLDVQFEINSSLPNLKINSDGTLTSNSSSSFYSTTTPGADWTIKANGNFEIQPYHNPQLTNIEYSLFRTESVFIGDTYVYLNFEGVTRNYNTRAWYIVD